VTRYAGGSRVLDIRTYKLVPGGGEAFDRIVHERALPLLHRFGIDVVGYGPSLDDGDLYCLIRSFDSTADRDEQLEAFYGSDEWRQNHREHAMALIDSYHIVALLATMRDDEEEEA
jgi:hypothetical protein